MTMGELHGLRILNTRPDGQNTLLNQHIIEQGGVAISCPALKIKPLPAEWLQQLPSLQEVHYAIFISANAAKVSFTLFSENNIDWPSGIQVIAIGESSAKELHAHQVTQITTPTQAHSEGLLALDFLQLIHNQTILLFKGEGGRPLIAETLRRRGARVTELEVYQRILPEIDSNQLRHWHEEDAFDIILYTSEGAIHNIFTLFGRRARKWLQSKPALVISTRLAVIASELGIENIHICSPNQILQGFKIYNKGRIHGYK